VIEVVPLRLVNLLSFLTVFSVMTSIGTAIAPSVCLEYIRSPYLLIRALINVLVIVPAIGIAASFAFGLSLPEKVGITLMVIAPGAPLALRRALGSGGDAGFAPTLQVAVAILAVAAVPFWVIIGNAILGTHGIAGVGSVATQVFLAQLLPLVLGALVKRVAPISGAWVGTVLGRAGGILLIAALVSQVVDMHSAILSTRPWPVAVAAVTTIMALLLSYSTGGRSPEVRHSVAIAGALRNVGLALLLATTNQVPPVVHVVIVSYALTAIIIVAAYILVRDSLYHRSGTN